MPYACNTDLPASIQRNLPTRAPEIFRAAFNRAWKDCGARDPARRGEIAHRAACSAVKRRHRKLGEVWIPV